MEGVGGKIELKSRRNAIMKFNKVSSYAFLQPK